MKEFIDYVMSFYGQGEIYDIGVTIDEVIEATSKRLDNKAIPFVGDTIDREMVRDIIISERNVN